MFKTHSINIDIKLFRNTIRIVVSWFAAVYLYPQSNINLCFYCRKRTVPRTSSDTWTKQHLNLNAVTTFRV